MTSNARFWSIQWIAALAWVGLMLSSCNVTKHLDTDKGQRLLTKNSLEFKSTQRLSLSERTSLTYQMAGLYKQKPNRGLPGFKMRLAAHYKYQNRTSKFATWVKTKYAEKPTLYDDDLAHRTATNFENFMRQRGYSKATCTYETQFPNEKTAKTHYILTLGPLYTIRNVVVTSRDTAVLRLVQADRSASLVTPGGALNSQSFDGEKVRITAMLRNNGYARFIPNFIEFWGDSTGTQTDVTIEILPQNDTTMHQKFWVDEVSVFSSLEPNLVAMKNEMTIDSIKFYSSEPYFFVKPKHLNRLIVARPGNLYRQEEFERTNRNLSSMGAFRFVKVRPNTSPTDSVGLIDSEISFAPDKRFSYGNDLNFNYSDGGVTGGLIGGSAFLFFRHKNLFHGAEQLQNNLQYNVEFDIERSSGSLIFSQEFKFGNDLTLPRFVDYFGLWRGLHRLRIGGKPLISNDFYNRLRFDTKTRISATFDYLRLVNFYEYNLLNLAFGYQLAPSRQQTWQIGHMGIDMLRAQLSDERCAENPLICRQFDDQLFTGFLLRNLTFGFNTPTNPAGERWRYRFSYEASGLELLLLSPNRKLSINDLDFAQYIRLETGGEYTRNFTKELAFAGRISSGVVVPLGFTSTTPYVKQFFIGGPSSLRAWRIRELGPGSYVLPVALSEPPFFQAADFRFEFNAELRFPIFWWFKGAVFLDGGNIWSIDPSDERAGSRLGWQSYQNTALGTGAGLRFDFGYSIIRLDLGLKVRQPFRSYEAPNHWVYWSRMSWRDLSNWNLAVGYPF
jgi:outer membrane protein insertion porin family